MVVSEQVFAKIDEQNQRSIKVRKMREGGWEANQHSTYTHGSSSNDRHVGLTVSIQIRVEDE